MPATPSAEIAARVVALLGARPIAWQPVAGGYTPAQRWRVRLETGAGAFVGAFVKAAVGEETAAWLRTEARVYAAVHGDFMPRVLGWDEADPHPILILEDLGAADWPPPWSDERVARVLSMLGRVAATPAPEWLPTLDSLRADLVGWEIVARDPAPFLALGLCSPEWLAAALPTLLAAEAAAPLDGDALVHFDVRSDNLCFAGARTLLVDWNWAARGNPLVDVVAWLPSLRAEGGPDPRAVLPDAPGSRELAVLMAGFFAARAGLPDPTPDGRLRPLQVTQLRVALPWAAAELGLPVPDGAKG